MSEAPDTDDLSGLDSEAIRLTAYFLWEQDGRPPGREFDYWLKAREQHRRQHEFDQLIAAGDPDDGEWGKPA